MTPSQAFKALPKNVSPVIKPLDKVWIRKYRLKTLAKTLSWAQTVRFNRFDDVGLRDLCQLKKPFEQDALSVPPLGWGLTLKETQVTKAVRLFLYDGLSVHKGRVESFLRALNVRDLDPNNEYYVANEHAFGNEEASTGGRFDIVIAWDKVGETYKQGLVCEFKLDANIGDGQLDKYETAADAFIENPRFAFISHRYKPNDLKALRAIKKVWTQRLWWKFLRDWENEITDQIDDYVFRQFRATLWEQLT